MIALRGMLPHWLLFMLLYSAGAYAQPIHLYNKPYSDKKTHIDSLERSSKQYTERVSQARQFDEWAEKSKDAELAGILRVAAYRLRIGSIEEDTATAEKYLTDLLERNGKSKFLQAEILQELGKFYLDGRRKNSHAFEYFLMAYNIYSNFSAEDLPQKRYYIYDLAGAYYRYEDHLNAIRYMSEALHTPHREVAGMDMTMYNTIGLSYKELKKYDSSLLYLDNAYRTAVKNNDSVWIGILSGNVGEIYFLQQRYPEAIIKLQECLNVCLPHRVKSNAVMAACRLTGIYLDMGQVALAEETLDRVLTVPEIGAFSHRHHVNQRLYSVMARLYAAKGNTALAYRYADSALRSKDSAHAELTEINRVRAAEKAEYVQHKLELSKVAQEKQRQFFVRNMLIVVIGLVTLIGLLFINRQRLRHKKLVAELDAVTNKLIHIRHSAPESKAENVPVKDEEEEIDHEAISKLENSSLLTNEQWDDFRKLFDKVHKGFLNNLRRKIPDLTPADIRFVALTKLKLSPKEMASMLGVSPATIRIYRFRLRKKLGLDKEEDIEDLINKI